MKLSLGMYCVSNSKAHNLAILITLCFFFSGDDLGNLDKQDQWPPVDPVPFAFGDKDPNPPNHKVALQAEQRKWLNLGHLLTAAEHLFDNTMIMHENLCEVQPENVCAVGCATNPGRTACQITVLVSASIAYALLVSATVAYQIEDDAYTLLTLGEDEAVYGFQYSKATYINIERHSDWMVKALKSIRTNMKGQHAEMKRQLQERHKDIANHVGEDISDAQNALGLAIVGARNQLGEDIVGAQNALGEYIVNAQNDNGKAITDAQNYITLQHNKLSAWLHGSLCTLVAQNGVTCESFIGPLEHDQSFIPVEFHWPEGEPTLIERLKQIQRAISTDTLGDGSIDDSAEVQVTPEAKSAAMQARVEAMETVVASKIDAAVSKLDIQSVEIRNKVDDMQSKVDDMQSKVDEKLKNMKEDMKSVKMEMKNMKGEVKEVQAFVVKTIQEEMKSVKDMLASLLLHNNS